MLNGDQYTRKKAGKVWDTILTKVVREGLMEEVIFPQCRRVGCKPWGYIIWGKCSRQ